jgi:hypothetical protein
MLTRRRLLALLGVTPLVLAVEKRARALGKKSKFRFGVLQLAGVQNPNPTALVHLAERLDEETSISVDLEQAFVEVSATDERLFDTPLLWLTGDRGFPLPSPREIEALRRFLDFGGFLVIDSAEGRAGGEFDASVRALAAEIFQTASGAAALAPLPDDHVVFKSFYLLDSAPGRYALTKQLEAGILDGRAAVLYSQNDLGGAWEREPARRDFTYACYPGGEDQRDHAFRVGVNIVMYALCLDYKTDQVHVPFILRRRKWKDSP